MIKIIRLKLFLIILLFSSCSKTIYLSNEGEIVGIYDNHIKVVFPCQNVKRPDCFGSADFSKDKFPFAYLGQTVILTDKQ